MSTQVLDFHALVQALEQHPEWRAELRRLVLSEELLALPSSFKRLEEDLARLASTVQELVTNQVHMQAALEELAQAQKRTEQRVEELAQAQKRTEQRVEELAQAQKRTEQRVEELAQAQKRTEQRVEELAQAQKRTEESLQQLAKRVETLAVQLGEVRGQVLEMRFQQKAPAYLGRHLRRVRVVPSERLAELLDEAVDAGRITLEERQAVLLADAVVQGLGLDGSPLSLVVEVSVVVDEHDLARAVERAEILGKALGTRAQAAVAGQEISQPTQLLARRLGVWCLQDGRQLLPAQQS